MPTNNAQKNPKKNSSPPPEILKNPQKTFPRPLKTFKKPSPETFLWVLAFKCNQSWGARACARAPPFVTFSGAKTLKNVSGEGFFEGFRGPREGFLRVFQNFWGRRRVFLGFFDGFLLALEKLSYFYANRNRNKPEPERTGTGWTEPGVQRSGCEPNRTEPNRGLPVLLSFSFSLCLSLSRFSLFPGSPPSYLFSFHLV